MADVQAHHNNNQVYRAQDEYRRAREDGLQPESVSLASVNEARRLTDATGVAYRADKVGGGSAS